MCCVPSQAEGTGVSFASALKQLAFRGKPLLKSAAGTKYPRKLAWKEEGFLLAQGFPHCFDQWL